ncbi:MAG: type III-B CRISPR module RAMP protein Cmr6 [Gemmataceae bacterium]|nr:type III-B CRISPR module RAMP protein Cmr6 [Gemmataceae bacterium]
MRSHVLRYLQTGPQGDHPGLLLDRFLVSQDEKASLIAYAARARPEEAMYRLAFARHCAGLLPVDVKTPEHGRLIVGLGQKGVVEAGLRLHHTYGTPLIPGSALKGLAAHYAHEQGGAKYHRETGEIHRLLFGTTEENGCIRFDDAWARPGYDLHRDVMTPHHPEWQEGGKAPTDFDSPVPVPFVSVSGTFRLALSWQGPLCDDAAKWVKRTMDILTRALAEWGVGGKTSSGYGRLVKPGGEKMATPPTSTGKATAPTKREVGTPATVKILGARPKGGFDVQEEGRNKGTLTVGTPPAGMDTTAGNMVDVFLHVDDSRNPQYKWTHVPPKPPPPKGGKPRR